MMTLSLWNNVFIGGTLVFAIVMMGKPRLPAMLRAFALSSLFLAGLIVTSSLAHGEEQPYAIALVNIAFKVILAPWILLYAARKVNASMALKFYLRPTSTYFAALLVLVASVFIAMKLPDVPYLSIALVLLGLLFMIIRKDLYSQIMGFMVMENGIAAYGILMIGGFPFMLETGILFVVITGAILMAILSRHVQELYATGDTESLTELTE
jgi:hydrogenase-4 component E